MASAEGAKKNSAPRRRPTLPVRRRSRPRRRLQFAGKSSGSRRRRDKRQELLLHLPVPSGLLDRRGKFALCGSVGRSVGRSVGSGVWSGFVFGVPGAGCLRGGSIPPPGVVESRRQDFFGVSSLLRVSRSVCGGVGKENLPGAGCLCGGSIPPPGVMEPALLGVAGWCCRGIGGCLPLLSRASARAAAIRSALCVVFGG